MHDTSDSDNAPIEFGVHDKWGEQPVAIRGQDRGLHCLVLGMTGVGKSTLLENACLQAIWRGESVCLIDPHGDLAEAVLDRVPARRSHDVVYFNPADATHAAAFNWLAEGDQSRRHLVVSGIVTAMQSVWADSWGPRLSYVLNACLLSLASVQNTTLLGVNRLLQDEAYRRHVVSRLDDPFLLGFWSEFESLDRRFRAEVTSPVINKLSAIALSPVLRPVMGQVAGKFDFRHVIDTGRIFVANLAKGLVGEDKSALLGSLLVAAIYHAAQSRADVPRQERRPFTLVIDEAHSFHSGRLPQIVSESRKLGLRLMLANQTTSQFDEATLASLLGNVGTLVSFRVGVEDARLLAPHFGGDLAPGQFADLPNHCAFVRAMHGGVRREPVLCRTHPPLDLPGGRLATVVELSRKRHATPRHVVEDKLARWMRS